MRLRLVFGLLAILAIAQLAPVSRTNPPTETSMPLPIEVQDIFDRACADCHSNDTSWPWYSRIAPVSWWVASHVQDGRREFNASTWNRLSEARRLRLPRRIWREVSEGAMPPWYYTPIHPRARLSANDTATLHDWFLAQPPAPELPGSPRQR